MPNGGDLHATAASSTDSQVKTVLRVVTGNFLELYDFMVYGYFASHIAKAYFPSESHTASLIASLAVYGAGFLMRPIGAIVLGAYIDRHGRRSGLIAALALMAVGTLLVALVPEYRTIGITAPILVLFGRLVQGFSAGAELGAVSVYLAEIATPGRRGFYVSWQAASQQLAVVFAAALGFTLTSLLSAAAMADWGWRVPFLVGCLIIPLVFRMRESLAETRAFMERKHRPRTAEILRSMVQSWRIVLSGVALVLMSSVMFNLIAAYTRTFGREVLKLSDGRALAGTACIALSNFLWLPVMGALLATTPRFHAGDLDLHGQHVGFFA